MLLLLMSKSIFGSLFKLFVFTRFYWYWSRSECFLLSSINFFIICSDGFCSAAFFWMTYDSFIYHHEHHWQSPRREHEYNKIVKKKNIWHLNWLDGHTLHTVLRTVEMLTRRSITNWSSMRDHNRFLQQSINRFVIFTVFLHKSNLLSNICIKICVWFQCDD